MTTSQRGEGRRDRRPLLTTTYHLLTFQDEQLPRLRQHQHHALPECHRHLNHINSPGDHAFHNARPVNKVRAGMILGIPEWLEDAVGTMLNLLVQHVLAVSRASHEDMPNTQMTSAAGGLWQRIVLVYLVLADTQETDEYLLLMILMQA